MRDYILLRMTPASPRYLCCVVRFVAWSGVRRAADVSCLGGSNINEHTLNYITTVVSSIVSLVRGVARLRDCEPVT